MISSQAAATDLSEETCVITGACGGVGHSVEEHFLALGAKVLATDTSDGSAMADLSRSYGGIFEYQTFDLTAAAGLIACCDWVQATSLDVHFNNAVIFDMGDVLEADLQQFDLNLCAMYQIMQSSAQSMFANGTKGSIANMSSPAVHQGEALAAHFCASKAAVISYTQSPALALVKHDIRINTISRGVVDTPMWDSADALFAKYENRPLGEKNREVDEKDPLGYMGAPSDIARVAVLFACKQSDYKTAQTLGVDGGSVLS